MKARTIQSLIRTPNPAHLSESLRHDEGRHRAFCFWCLVAAGATFTTLATVAPEARAAIASLKGTRERSAV